MTPQLLSIPPYLSTTWNNVASLHAREKGALFCLVVTLQNGAQVEAPNLSKGAVEAIFEGHARYAGRDAADVKSLFAFLSPPGGDEKIDMALGLEHNSAQSRLPPLAPEVLEKMLSVLAGLGLATNTEGMRPELDCQCIYCQCARVLQSKAGGAAEEEVALEDLSFRDWEVTSTADKLYTVRNPLNLTEQYSVFLGEPLGCTCGEEHCEHIKAVLRS
ncbi:MAG: hypothetical protein RL235_549 [Chlamydiota bacterium]